MAYETGHRLDCDLSTDPIECHCGEDWVDGKYVARPKQDTSNWTAKDYARSYKIAYTVPDDSTLAESIAEINQKIAHTILMKVGK